MSNESAVDIQWSVVGDAFVITVSGEIDMTSVPELSKAIESAPDQSRRVVVDLEQTMFLDSSGLNSLIRGKRGLDARSIAFSVVAPRSGVVRRVFEITHLIEALSVVDSLDEALA